MGRVKLVAGLPVTGLLIAFIMNTRQVAEFYFVVCRWPKNRSIAMQIYHSIELCILNW